MKDSSFSGKLNSRQSENVLDLLDTDSGDEHRVKEHDDVG